MGYDIIGDVHGHYSLLKKLLVKLGYTKTEQGYVHPERKAIFVGDFVNRGPEIRKTVRAIRLMVENKAAYAVLGNHEINTIIYHLKDKNGFPLVKRSGKYFLSLFKTINEFSGFSHEWKSNLKWLRSLPLSLELDGIRVVHACWDPKAIEIINTSYVDGRIKKSTFRKIQNNQDSDLSKSVWRLTKGINLKLPNDIRIINNKGTWTKTMRSRWWENPIGKTFEEISFESKCRFPEYTVPKELVPESLPYPEKSPIVFFGHYCRGKGPYIIAKNICCVDSCVTGSGKLTAYRWGGEKELKEENLIQVKM